MKSLLMSVLLKIIERLLTKELLDSAKEALIQYLRDLALQTENELDDGLVDILEKALDA